MAIRLPRLIRDFSIVSDKGYPTVSYHQWWETVLRQIESSFERIELALAAAGIAIDGMTSAVWGNITGTLADQTDLQTALNAKQDVATLPETVDDRVASLLVAGTNVTLTYNDVANTLTVDAAGGGGGGLTSPQAMARTLGC